MSKTIAEMLVKIGADTSNFEKEMQNVQKALANTGKKFKEVGSNMSQKITAPIMAFGTAAVYVGAQFDASMSKVAAISGATGKEFEDLRNQAKDLGATTQFSASEAADGMSFLAMAGFETSEIIAAMPGMLNLAAAGQLDLATAADVASNIMSGFGIEAGNAAHVADVLAKVSSSANTDVSQMGEAMKYAAPVAASLGVSMEEAAAAIGFMSDAGIQGSMAGTAMRSGLLRLADPSKEAADAMEQLGINAFDSEGKMKPLDQIIGELSKSTANLKDEQKTQALSAIFGTEAVSGWMAVMDRGGAALGEFSQGLVNADGAAGKMAGIMNDNLAGAVKELKSALEGLAIEFSDVLAPVVREMAGHLTGLVRWFSGLSPATKTVILVIAALAAAIGPLLVAIGFIMTGISALIPVFAFLISPVGLVIAAIVVLIGILVYLYARFEWMRTATAAIWEGIKMIIMSVVNAIMGIFTGFVQFGKGIWEFFAGILTGDWSRAWEGIKNILIGAAKVLYGIMTLSVVGRITKLFLAFIKGGKKWGGNLIKGFADGIKNGIGSVISAAKNVMNSVKKFLGFNSPSEKGEGRFIEHWGANMVGGFLDGVKSMGPQVAKTVGGITAGMGVGVNVSATGMDEIEANNRVRHEFSPVTVNITGDNGQLNNAAIARAIESRIAETIARDNRRLPNRASLGGAR